MTRKIDYFFIVFCLLLFSCKNQKSVLDNNTIVSTSKTNKKLDILSFKPSDECLNQNIIVYNPDGSIYLTIDFKNYNLICEDSTFNLAINEKSALSYLKISPLNFYIEGAYLIEFEVKDIFDNKAIIYLDSLHTIEKLLDLTDCFELQNYKEYLLSSYIDFEQNKNPLRMKNDNQSEVILIKENIFRNISFQPTIIIGEWMFIKCSDIENCGEECEENISGWIKWEENNNLLIKIYRRCG